MLLFRGSAALVRSPAISLTFSPAQVRRASSYTSDLAPPPGGKGPSRRVLWFFNYVLTKQTDEVSSALLPPSNPFDLRTDRGPSSMDARHRFFALTNGSIGKGFQLGANFHSNSALPYNITTGFDN